MFRELELCFTVPPQAREALRRALEPRGRAGRALGMQARYFDTASGDLASAGMALRVRREGRRWVQTLKTSDPGELARSEFSVLRPDGTLDPAALADTPAARVLAKAGVVPAEALHVVYETSIRRKARALRAKGARIEVALDEGAIVASGQRMRVLEIEFELVRGDPSALFDVAMRWQRRLGLRVEPRSKAERGQALLRGERVEPPRKAAGVRLERSMSPARALRVVAIECAEQILRNVAALAGGGGGEEHVHQLRVGLRRLRSAWRFFGAWTAPLPDGLLEGARSLFARMGVSRDAAVQAGDLWPRLRAAGMPDHEQAGAVDIGNARAEAAAAAQAIAQDPDVQAWMVALLGWIEGLHDEAAPALVGPVDPAGPSRPVSEPASVSASGPASGSLTEPVSEPASEPASDPASEPGSEPASEPGSGQVPANPAPLRLRLLLRRRLARWHRAVAIGGTRFSVLEPEEQHALRKRAKRLRYATEFCAALLEPKDLARYLRRLARLQDALGELNDLAVASDRLLASQAADPSAWFARGWIAARAEVIRTEAAGALDGLPSKPPPFDVRSGRAGRRGRS